MVETIAELAKLRGLGQKPLAEKAWPDSTSADSKWRYIRRADNPRGLQLCDAYDLACALGMSFVEVCGLAQAKLMQKMQGQDVNFRAVEREAIESEACKEQKTIGA